MGGETTYCSFFSTHFFSWSAQRHAHFWGHRWLRRMWGLKGDIFQKGVHSVCSRFKSSLLPSVAASHSLLGLADVWGSFLGSLGQQRATCQPDFRGNSYERRITLHKETEPLSLPATFRLFFLCSNFFLKLPFCYFWILKQFKTLACRFSPPDYNLYQMNVFSTAGLNVIYKRKKILFHMH